jgi:hypothetical protein
LHRVWQVHVSSDVNQVLADQVVAVLSSDVKWGVAMFMSLFVWILTFSYQDSNDVKIALGAGVPDV